MMDMNPALDIMAFDEYRCAYEHIKHVREIRAEFRTAEAYEKELARSMQVADAAYEKACRVTKTQLKIMHRVRLNNAS